MVATAIGLACICILCGPCDAKERVIEFPEKTPIGKLYSFPEKESLIGMVKDRFFAVAVGKVRVPDGMRILLKGGYTLRDDLSPLSKLKPDDVEYLNLDKLPITAAQTKHLRHLSGLRRLDMEDSDITDEALKDIGMLKNLRTLVISKTLINGSGFKYLTGLTELRELAASNNDLKPSSVAPLVSLKKLEVLRLGATRMTEESTKYIGKIQSLDSLRLAGNADINDRAISHLTGLANLTQLNLRETSVTIGVLKSLIKIKRLRHLELSSRHFNAQQFQLIKRELPKCRIKIGFGSKVSPDLFGPLH